MKKQGPSKSWLGKVAGATAVTASITIAVIVWQSDTEGVREIRVVDSPKSIRSVISGQVQFDKSEWKELIGIEDSYIELGTDDLEWSSGGSSGGYLYFWQGRRPWEHVWEFAPYSRRVLDDLRQSDADCRFYPFESAERWDVFGGRMRTNSVAVYDGDIVLVRHVNNSNVVYAVQIYEQEMNGAQIRVKALAR